MRRFLRRQPRLSRQNLVHLNIEHSQSAEPICSQRRSRVQDWRTWVSSGEPAIDDRRPTEYFKDGGDEVKSWYGHKDLILGF